MPSRLWNRYASAVENSHLCPPELRSAIAALRTAIEPATDAAPGALALAAEAAEVIGALTGDPTLAAAVLAQPLVGRPGVTPERLAALVGENAARLGLELHRLGEVGLAPGWAPEQGLDPNQAEVVRKMLLAVVGDQRLVLARLAEVLVRLRHARELAAAERERLATEVRALFAPLANRLGISQIKWELEDLSFRHLHPEEYKRLATALNEKRADRERYIETFCARLQADLSAAGVKAEVYGRPKHIYSIHRKMLRKHLDFEQIFDVRAVRIVVQSVAECYEALSLVHSQWQYLPSEFDDYIATPKGNNYRSIHTAVTGPEDRTIEIQIRTREMHEHAELGVASHWQYKEGGTHAAAYAGKIEAVRRLLAGEPGSEADLLEGLRGQIFSDHIYALTPKGEVIELPRHATPLDFAYHVHSNLGHRCRGAKVNGRIVPLTYQLANGEVIEIITGKHPAPSRDWLAPELGYLASSRSRAKVRAWFRQQDAGDNRTAGRSIAERELVRAGATAEVLPTIAQDLRARDLDEFYQLLGEGEITATQLAHALLRLARAEEEPEPRRRLARSPVANRGQTPVEIEGVGDLPIILASCCAPIRPQPIVGYISVGRGVTIHRADCANFARMREEKPERMLKVEWSSDASTLDVGILVTAYDRRGLVRDLTDVVAQEHISIEGMNTDTDEDRIARFDIRLGINDLEQLANLIRKLRAVPNVSDVRRTR